VVLVRTCGNLAAAPQIDILVVVRRILSSKSQGYWTHAVVLSLQDVLIAMGVIFVAKDVAGRESCLAMCINLCRLV